jgi:glyoxylase-like metal-dependent hydrolase (beta-lactamase superfamily II)
MLLSTVLAGVTTSIDAIETFAHAVLQGLGVVRAALSCAGRLPDNVYISHNHTDHAGVLQCRVPAASQPAASIGYLAKPNTFACSHVLCLVKAFHCVTAHMRHHAVYT